MCNRTRRTALFNQSQIPGNSVQRPTSARVQRAGTHDLPLNYPRLISTLARRTLNGSIGNGSIGFVMLCGEPACGRRALNKSYGPITNGPIRVPSVGFAGRRRPRSGALMCREAELELDSRKGGMTLLPKQVLRETLSEFRNNKAVFQNRKGRSQVYLFLWGPCFWVRKTLVISTIDSISPPPHASRAQHRVKPKARGHFGVFLFRGAGRKWGR